MISSLRGTVLTTGSDHVVIEVGGVGFQVFTTVDVARDAHPGGEARLHTTLIVREDALTLYGFVEAVELEVFGTLLSVTGVGPKSALGVLGHLSVAQIAEAVANDDDAPFRRVSGIGPKTAKLIVVQLAGKLQIVPTAPASASAPSDVVTQVTTALIGLGWSEKVAQEAATNAVAESPDAATVSALLRVTLATLGPAKGGARA